ncbi:MAG TPA: FtsX-like permease family protein [Chthonomonadales bacterium]|nr:FtsX-like permease family protein [Chthonomonadales bacterium]
MSDAGTNASRPGVDKRRQMQLPFSKAVEISLKSVRIRFARSLITAGGIFLGIAFFSSVQTSAIFSDIHADLISVKRERLAAGEKLTAEEIRMVSAADANKAEEANARTRLQWLSIMGLLVCTVGITNAMLMSVTERYKEIGTMKCLGALDSFVVKLFFIESCLLGFLASLSGCLMGWFFISLVNVIGLGSAALSASFWEQSLVLIATSTALGTLLTFVATIPPAVRAAKMPPAAALRVEI